MCALMRRRVTVWVHMCVHAHACVWAYGYQWLGECVHICLGVYGYEFEQAPGDGEEQESLECCKEVTKKLQQVTKRSQRIAELDTTE